MKKFTNLKMDESIFNQNLKIQSRRFSIIFSAILSLMLFFQLLKFLPSNKIVIIANFVLLGMSLFLILKPQYIVLWVFNFFIAFYAYIYIDWYILGLVCYFACIVILLRCNFFKTNLFFKVLILTILLIIPFISRYMNLNLNKLKVTIFNTIFGISILKGLFLFFSDDLKKYYVKKDIFKISTLNLSKRQKECFLLASKKLSFKDISQRLFVSESVVKKEMIEIYKSLDIENYYDFLLFLEKYEIIK